jgi:hypothetical protein
LTPRDTKGRKVAVWVDMSSTEVVEAYDAWLKAEALEVRHFQTADWFERLCTLDIS